MKILILLLYYNRPQMVCNALQSIVDANAHHEDWELAFIDDSSPQPGAAIAHKELGSLIEKTKFYHTNGEENYIGRFMNNAMRESTADIGIMLCDDDALVDTYLTDLDKWFTDHPKENSCFSHVKLYNPAWQSYRESLNVKTTYNYWKVPIWPARRVDASQVAWRTRLSKRGVWFNEHITKNLDNDFYIKITRATRRQTPFSGFKGQCKGEHSTKLHNFDVKDVRAGMPIDIEAARIAGGPDGAIWIINRHLKKGRKKKAIKICREVAKYFPDDERIRDFIKKLL